MRALKKLQVSLVLWLRLGLIIATLVIFFGLRFYKSDSLLFVGVLAPIAVSFGLSYSRFGLEYKSRLIAFALPVAVIYWLGFYPWITNFDEVAVSSSTSALDFIFVPIWSLVYAVGLLALHELVLQVVLVIKRKK